MLFFQRHPVEKKIIKNQNALTTRHHVLCMLLWVSPWCTIKVTSVYYVIQKRYYDKTWVTAGVSTHSSPQLANCLARDARTWKQNRLPRYWNSSPPQAETSTLSPLSLCLAGELTVGLGWPSAPVNEALVKTLGLRCPVITTRQGNDWLHRNGNL